MQIQLYPIKIDKNLVFKYLGYVDTNVPKEITYEIDEVIEQSYELIEPKICYKENKIKYDKDKNEILLPNGNTFKEDYIVRNLKDANYIVSAVVTVGKKVSEKINETFSKGDYLKGMIYDVVANTALEHLRKSFEQDLMKKAREKGFGITHRLSPGSNGWSIKDQKIIFEILNTKSIGVFLRESYLMDPIKSTSLVYGIGKNIKVSIHEDVCDECPLVDCMYRHLSNKSFYNINVDYMGKKKTIKAENGANLFKVLTENGIDIPSECGGNQICGKCKVIVDTNNEISKFEKQFLTDLEIKKGVRLACYVKVDKDLNVITLNTEENYVVLTSEGAVLIDSLNPRIIKRKLTFSEPTLKDQRGDLERLEDALLNYEKKIKISTNLLNKLPDIMRNNKNIVVVMRNNEIISLEKNDEFDKTYGIAIDIGTTTIAAYLYDIKTGEKIDVYSTLNLQRTYGADVISRINYTITEKDGLFKLHKIIINDLNDIVEGFCQRNELSSSNIYEMTLVGNTTMIHLALKVPVKNISNAPFIPAFTSEIEVKSEKLGVKINPEGYVMTLPMVASYIGADTIAGILACGMYEKEELSLFIDIGTNSEIVLGNRDKLLACSAAAGPAFEGGSITFGIGGIKGAIDHVDLEKKPIYTTIGNVQPSKGICGSGIVDAIAELVKKGIIDKTGRILKKVEIPDDVDETIVNRIKKYNGETAFLIDEESGIYLTQKDVRQLQLAKGAIFAGIKILSKELGIETEDIKRVYLAGGFGNYINVDSAVIIGLIPKELKDKVLLIGNAAGRGAVKALLSNKEFDISRDIKNKIKYIELSSMASFSEEFMNSMYFE